MAGKRRAGKRLAREKVKKWKKALREFDAITEDDVVSPEEAESQALLATLWLPKSQRWRASTRIWPRRRTRRPTARPSWSGFAPSGGRR